MAERGAGQVGSLSVWVGLESPRTVGNDDCEVRHAPPPPRAWWTEAEQDEGSGGGKRRRTREAEDGSGGWKRSKTKEVRRKSRGRRRKAQEDGLPPASLRKRRPNRAPCAAWLAGEAP